MMWKFMQIYIMLPKKINLISGEQKKIFNILIDYILSKLNIKSNNNIFNKFRIIDNILIKNKDHKSKKNII